MASDALLRQQQFRALAELDGVAYIVEDGEVVYVSPAIAKLLGVTPDALAAHVDGSARDAALAALATAMLGEGGELDFVRRDGRLVPLEIRVAAVGESRVGRLRDISARREQAATQRRFASMLNHEFRSPLSTIDGAIQRLEAGAAKVDEPTRQRYRKIQEAVDRLIRMLDDYLSPDRLADAGRAKPATAAEPMVLLRNAAEAARAQGRTVYIDGAGLPGSMRCSPDGLAMALRVLVENALQYTPAATPLHLTGTRSGHGIEFRVADEGPGVAPADQPRIFDKGFRGANATGRAGSGLGLYMARSVVEVHGGTLSMQNGEQGGAVFTIWLPLPR
jgi:signal transduction histidine kinase